MLRVSDLDQGCFGVNLFDTRQETINLVQGAIEADFVVEWRTLQRAVVDFSPRSEMRKVRVQFVTPTELKDADDPEFGILFARIRDRVSTLRALYGPGPLPIDFAAMGERAARVKMTRCDLLHIASERVSRNTGQHHSIGGFVGVAEYEGDLTEFVPYLEAARWTGVGRQTVWGKGEIHIEEI